MRNTIFKIWFLSTVLGILLFKSCLGYCFFKEGTNPDQVRARLEIIKEKDRTLSTNQAEQTVSEESLPSSVSSSSSSSSPPQENQEQQKTPDAQQQADPQASQYKRMSHKVMRVEQKKSESFLVKNQPEVKILKKNANKVFIFSLLVLICLIGIFILQNKKK